MGSVGWRFSRLRLLVLAIYSNAEFSDYCAPSWGKIGCQETRPIFLRRYVADRYRAEMRMKNEAGWLLNHVTEFLIGVE